MNHLIVTADDFGLAVEVNDAVEAAHRDGILSAASLMVAGPAAADAIRRARDLPKLKIGLHLVLVEGKPALPPERIPGLVGADGQFRTDMARLGLDIALSPSVRRQLAAEITAQFEAYRASGLPLDHVNAHKHFHLHPLIAHQIIAIGPRYGMRALRVPLEPSGVIARIEPGTAPNSWITAPWAALLGMQARRTGLTVPDAVFGLCWTGAMTANRVTGLLGNLPPGVVEIYTHPATSNDFAGHAPGYRYAGELEALRDRAAVEGLRRSEYRLGGFSDIATR